MGSVGVYISVKSEDMNITVPMERRITFLRGNSGEGKTSFVRHIQIALNNGNDDVASVDYPSGFDLFVVTANLKLILNSVNNAILVIDDNVDTESSGNYISGISEAQSLNGSILKKLVAKNLYLLIINRVDISDMLFGSILTKCDYSAKSILWWEYNTDKKEYIVEPALLKLPVGDVNSVDCILSEDGHGCTQFCSLMKSGDSSVHVAENEYTLVKTKDGRTLAKPTKDKICDILEHLKNFKSILLLVDLASFGKNISKLERVVESEGYSVLLDYNYECFEYLLLKSNLLKDSWDLSNEANDSTSWEKYFEVVIKSLLLDSNYSYSHSCNLEGRCWVKDCSMCRKLNCENRYDGDKLSYLLKGTEFEYLIKLLRGL